MHRSDTQPSADDFASARRGPRDVLEDAVALYLRAPTHEKGEIRAFAALVDGLLDGAGAVERRRVALALAPRADTPPDIARRLATDSIEIAEAMIERSPVLTSSDLVEIMRCGPAHVGCVGRRLDLAPDVAAVLIDTAIATPEPPPVVAGARRRADRRIEAAAPPAPKPVSIESSREPAPHDIESPALPPPMFRVPVRDTPSTAPSSGRTAEAKPEAPRSGTRLPSGLAFVALDTAARWRALQAAALEAAVGAPLPRDPATDAELLGERLLTALIADDRDFFLTALRDHLGLETGLVDAVLDEPSGEALAVLLIAAGIGEIRATTILLHHLGQAATLGMLQDLVALIERTSRRAAERLVAGWRAPSARRGTAMRQTDPAERRDGAAARGTPARDAGEAKSLRHGG